MKRSTLHFGNKPQRHYPLVQISIIAQMSTDLSSLWAQKVSVNFLFHSSIFAAVILYTFLKYYSASPFIKLHLFKSNLTKNHIKRTPKCIQ